MVPVATAGQWKRIAAWVIIAMAGVFVVFVIYVTFFPYVCYHAYGGNWLCEQLFPIYVPFDDFLKAHDSFFSQHVWKYLAWVESHLYHLG